MTFPEFMFRSQNKIPASQQNTPDRSLGFKESSRYNDNDKADVFMLLDL